MAELKFNIIEKVNKSEIPEQGRTSHMKGFRRSSVWTPILNALDDLDRYQCLKVKHNVSAPQTIHSRLTMYLRANPDAPDIKVAVRGEYAYFWVE